MKKEKSFKVILAELSNPRGLVSQSLPENPTPTEKAKNEFCQSLIRYKRVNGLSTRELASRLT